MPAKNRGPVSVSFLFILLVLTTGPTQFASAQPSKTGDDPYLYRVTTLRAEPGKLSELIDFLTAQRKTAHSGEPAGERVAHTPIIMRHSQGDQWDLLVMFPMGNYQNYYGAGLDARVAQFQARLDSLSAFREDLFAYGPPPAAVLGAYADNSFFHIEMFMALAGRKGDLIEEREMENAYLESTGQRTNLIWVGDVGSNVDVFTIGFYPSIVEFAAPSGVSDADADKAAIAAGFEARSTIGFYLRELISAHHDTLAIKVE